MPARHRTTTRGTLARAASEQSTTASHGTVSPANQEGVGRTARLLERLMISEPHQAQGGTELEGAMQAMNLTPGIQVGGTPAQDALRQSMQQLTLASEEQSGQDSPDNSESWNDSNSSSEAAAHQEYVHFYHHQPGESGPTFTFEEVSTVAEASQFSVDQGWMRFTYPLGLKAKEEPEFLIALQTLLSTKYLRGLPRVKRSIVKRCKYIDVCRQECILRPDANLDEIKVEVKVGSGAATRVKEIVIYLEEYNAGIAAHFARMELRGVDPDEDQDSASEADFIVQCLNERLRQAKVIDAWIDMSVSADGSKSIWNGSVFFLVALYSDIEMTKFTKSRKKVLKMQHGFLEVDCEHYQLHYPHRRWWCIYCKASLPFDKFHMIPYCPSTPCLCGEGRRGHRTLQCPNGRRNNRNHNVAR